MCLWAGLALDKAGFTVLSLFANEHLKEQQQFRLKMQNMPVGAQRCCGPAVHSLTGLQALQLQGLRRLAGRREQASCKRGKYSLLKHPGSVQK